MRLARPHPGASAASGALVYVAATQGAALGEQGMLYASGQLPLRGEAFAAVFAAIGITEREIWRFLDRFEAIGSLARSVLVLNQALDSPIERLRAPRAAPAMDCDVRPAGLAAAGAQGRSRTDLSSPACTTSCCCS